MRYVHPISVFLSAFLLFTAQPLVSRLITPRFGGSPSVWSAVLVTFQLLLLAGYSWAWQSLARLSPRAQRRAQAALLCLPLVVGLLSGRLPLALPLSGSAAGSRWPLLPLFGALFLAAAPAALSLASNAPLVQGWFAQRHPDRDPYPLYASSNLGSVTALLLYPLVIEPLLGLRSQLIGWASLFGLFAGITMLAGRSEATGAPPEPPPPGPPLAWPRKLRWLLLSALGTSLLMAVSLHINTDLASFPLLWVAPLGLYLLTFVVAFGPGIDARRRLYLEAPATAAVVTCLSLALLERVGPLPLVLGADLLALTLGCLLAHGDLAADRPQPGRLGEFFLWTSLGGAVGGLASSLLFPLLFESLVEYPLALVLTATLVTGRARFGRDVQQLKRLSSWLLPLACLIAMGVTAFQLTRLPAEQGALWQYLPVACLLVAMLRWKQPLQLGLVCALAAGLLLSGAGSRARILETRRSFFGVVRIEEEGGRRGMLHGTTLHGSQFTDPARARFATTYYHPEGPMGALVAALRPGQRGCVVGLGAGTLASAAEDEVALSFYEIDPLVEELARSWFTHLEATGAEVEVVLGDARLTLADSQRRCDVLIIDAFSSDAIPVHLLTEEALAVYLERLVPDGLLAFHISNRHLDLLPVIRGLAEAAGMPLGFCAHAPSPLAAAQGAEFSKVTVLGDPQRWPGHLDWELQPADAPRRLWTDDRASVLPLLLSAR